MYFRHEVEAMCVKSEVSSYKSCQTKIISVCPDVPLCSKNRSKGKLGITFHRFSVDKYAKESWIVRIRGDVGKNFQVSDCGLRFEACKPFVCNQFVQVYK